MTNQAPETLYTKSFFSSKEYNLSNIDQLKISEASAVSAKSESIPLDLIEEKPLTVEKINPQLVGFTLTCAFASAVFYMISVSTGQLVASVSSGLFLLATLGAFYMTKKMKIQSYTYHYANTDTPLFTLNSNQSNEHETSLFVDNLNVLIKASSEQEEPAVDELSNVIDEKDADIHEQEYLAYTYHLDYLYASGLVAEDSYQTIGKNIADMVFNKVEIDKSDSNIIAFPSRKI